MLRKALQRTKMGEVSIKKDFLRKGAEQPIISRSQKTSEAARAVILYRGEIVKHGNADSVAVLQSSKSVQV